MEVRNGCRNIILRIILRLGYGQEADKDFYGQLIDKNICEELIRTYDQASRQIYTLARVWKSFRNN